MSRTLALPSLRLLGVVLTSTGIAGATVAQSEVHQTSGAHDVDRLGTQVDGLGDVNGDGFDDAIVGAHLEDAQGADSGAAYVISGKDGSRLHSLTGDAAGDGFGYSVSSAGYIDFDNRPDFVVGAPGGGYARVFSGATGTVLATLPGAHNASWCVRDVGDVNADGRDDIGVGTWDDSSIGTNNGVLRVYSGLDWSLVFELYGNPWERYGASVAGLGDVDGDRHDDFIVGAIGLGGGTVYVHSGSDGSVLFSLHGDSPGDLLGWSVDGGLDCDFDGVPDWVVGAPGHDSWSGYARVYSGATGAILYTEYGEAESSTGISVAMTRDLDGNDSPDVLVGAESADGEFLGVITPSAGRVQVLDGFGGWESARFMGKQVASGFGASVAGAGDANGNGFGELIVGAPTTIAGGGTARGRAHVLSVIERGSLSSFCTALVNSSGASGHLSGQGSASVFVNDLVLRGNSLPGQTLTLSFYGSQPVQLPFGDGLLCVGAPLFRSPPQQTSGSSGLLNHHVDLMQPPAVSGAGRIRGGDTWYFQCWFRDTAAGGSGFNTTDGLKVDFLP